MTDWLRFPGLRVTRSPNTDSVFGVGESVELLASGATQHVLIPRSGERAWVYKIPAIFDSVLRWPPARAVSNRAVRRLTPDWLLVTYLRWQRVRSFQRMLHVLAGLDDAGLADALLPFSIHQAMQLQIRLNGESLQYRGPVLVQKHAEVFFELPVNLKWFDWHEIVEAQKRLWRKGFALIDAAGILGPNGWALEGQALKLADTGSLTTDRDRAVWAHQDVVLMRVARHWLGKCSNKAERSDLQEYFSFMLPQVQLERLNAVWKSEAAARQGVGRSGAPNRYCTTRSTSSVSRSSASR